MIPSVSLHLLTQDNTIPGNEYFADGRLRKYDIEAQARAVFANVRTVLDASGATWGDLVDVTVYLTDMGNLGLYREARNRFFATVTPPYDEDGILHIDMLR